MEKFICPRCGNTKEQFIGYKNEKPYCRLCLSFQGKKVNNDYKIKSNIELSLEYPLSEKQQIVSNTVLALLKQKKNVLIHAVTGAGKTELVYHSMEYYLKQGLHVGFSTPRKDVVIDLAPRIKCAFPKANVVSVYGDHNSRLEGDIIVLTTHQMYRYADYFDLLILDEIDAFPYKGNELLSHFFYQAVKGNYVLLSATPSKEDIENIKKNNGEVVELFERYHHKKLPVPESLIMRTTVQRNKILSLLIDFKRENKPVFVFVPTIDEGKALYNFLSIFLKDGSFVSSKEEGRRLDIELFKEHRRSFLVTTSILERGVTVKNLQVIVYHANHILFDRQTLVQISGRSGRKIDAPEGNVYFLADKESNSMNEAIYEISRYNKKANLL